MLLILFFCLCIKFRQPTFPHRPKGEIIYFQSFTENNWVDRWFVTNAQNYTGEWRVNTSISPQCILGEKMLYMMTKKSFHGVSSKLNQFFSVKNKTLVLQYEVRYQNNIECAGSYIKLFGKDFNAATLTNETRFILMFGPDHCDKSDKVHFILNVKNRITGKYEKKELKMPPATKLNKLTNLYTLIIRPDSTYDIRINDKKVKRGNIFTDFEPSINPPKYIDDPRDIKPQDWVDDPMMDDPSYPKPEDWDENEPEFINDPNRLNPPEGWYINEPKYIPDPDATKPKAWNEKKKGPWKSPQIPNPKCLAALGCGPYTPPKIKNPNFKGKWNPPKIPNPKYIGKWEARQIENPFYFELTKPSELIEDIYALGFELWTIHDEIGFNNILISTDEKAVRKWNKEHFLPKHELQEERIFRDIDNLPKKREKIKANGFLKGIKALFSNILDAYLDLFEKNPIIIIFLTSFIIFFIPFIVYTIFFKKKSIKKRLSPEMKKKIMKVLVQRERERQLKEEMEKKKMDDKDFNDDSNNNNPREDDINMKRDIGKLD